MELRSREIGEGGWVDVDTDLVRLADEAHAEGQLEPDPRLREAERHEPLRHPRMEGTIEAPQRDRRILVDCDASGLGIVSGIIRRKKTIGRQNACMRRHEHGPDAELLRHLRRMKGPAPP